MRARAYLAAGLSILLLAPCTWAQSRGMGGAPFGAPGFRGGMGALNPSASRPFNSLPQRPRFIFPFQFGNSPFFFPGFSQFGYPYYSMPYNCDTRFSSGPFNCQPLYPQGSASSDPYAAEAEGRSRASAGHPEAMDPAPLANPSDAAASRERVDPRDVVLTLDGREQPSSSLGEPLEIGSGHHTLSLSARTSTP